MGQLPDSSTATNDVHGADLGCSVVSLWMAQATDYRTPRYFTIQAGAGVGCRIVATASRHDVACSKSESLTEPSSGRRDCDGASVLTLTDRGRIVLRAMLPEL